MELNLNTSSLPSMASATSNTLINSRLATSGSANTSLTEHLQRLTTARAALEASLLKRMRGLDLPHSPVIDELIAHIPFQNKVAVIDQNLGIGSMNVEMVANHRTALQNCSAAMAAADHTFERFLRTPAVTDPIEFHVVTIVLEQALGELEAVYA